MLQPLEAENLLKLAKNGLVEDAAAAKSAKKEKKLESLEASLQAKNTKLLIKENALRKKETELSMRELDLAYDDGTKKKASIYQSLVTALAEYCDKHQKMAEALNTFFQWADKNSSSDFLGAFVGDLNSALADLHKRREKSRERFYDRSM